MAVDTESGEVVGQAIWEVVGGEGGEGGGLDEGEGEGGLGDDMDGGLGDMEGKGRLGEGAWDSEEEKGFAEGLYGELVRQREGFLRGVGGRGVGMLYVFVYNFDFFFPTLSPPFFPPLRPLVSLLRFSILSPSISAISSPFLSFFSQSGKDGMGGCVYRFFFYIYFFRSPRFCRKDYGKGDLGYMAIPNFFFSLSYISSYFFFFFWQGHNQPQIPHSVI